MTRPTVAEILDYRAHVDARMAEADGPREVIELGLHHEQQHQELMLTDLKHLFALNPLEPVYRAAAFEAPRATALEWLEVPEGIRELGHAGDGFGFDNERPRHRTLVHGFRFASRLVTAGEYAAFIADRGYQRPELWLSDGWATLQREGWQAPIYWRNDGGDGDAQDFTAFTLAGRRPLFAARAGPARQLLRGRRLRALGRRAPADGGRVGDGGARRRRARALRRRLAVDAERLRALPRIPPARRRARRVQWKVHVQPARAARLVLGDAARPRAHDLSQLLSAERALAIHEHPTGAGLMRSEMPQRAAVPTEDRLMLVEADGALPSDFAEDVRAGLTAPRKRLSCRYFYDAEGSVLFEEICALPEYYLTRAEQEILDEHAAEIVAAAAPEAALVELGSGSAVKTRTLIEAALGERGTVRYVPIDISRSMLLDSSRALIEDYAAVQVTAIAAEYRAGLRWLERQREAKLVLWLGSNVGNFDRGDAARFLRGVRATMGPSDRLVMGVDLRKSREALEAAYDDAAGVTARFNLNLLARINRELAGGFELDQFRHRARWNERLGRVEINLESRRAQTVPIDALQLDVSFNEGERIYTESSYKYSFAEIERLARSAGLVVAERWLDRGQRFSVNLLAPLSG